MIRRFAWLLGACLVLAAAFHAAADLVICIDGRELEGEVTVKDETVIIKGRFGQTVLQRGEVREIRKGGGAADEFQKKLEALEKSDKAKDADAHYGLGAWAKENGIEKQARARFERAIEINPDHEEARKALGYMKYLGQWVPEEDAMKAKGMVKVAGKWVTKEEADRLVTERKDPPPAKTGAAPTPIDPKKIAPEVPNPPTLVACPACAGKGFVPGTDPCRRCKGTGKMYNDGRYWLCVPCAGTGKVGCQCITCGGGGKVWKKAE